MRIVHGWRSYAPDVGLACAVAGVQVIGALAAPASGPQPRPVDYVVVLVGSLALAACRRAPVVALLVTTACMLVYSLRTDPGPSAAFPVLITVFGAARSGHRTLAAAAGIVYLGGILAAGVASAAGQPAQQQFVERTGLLVGWFVAAGVAGTVSRHRHAYLQQAEQRAAEAERTREEAALRRAGEERLRIARELHDSLTHSISVIKVQAGVAIHLARKRGEEVPATLLAIQEASGEAMRELRATLEVLRDSGDQPSGSGVDQLADLVERARSTGLPVAVTVAGPVRALSSEVDRAAYRIVQEALTNVSRHAGAASATVRVDYLPDGVLVQVDDDGRAAPGTSPVSGVGLIGMRERVAALGGVLRAGPRPEGGFTVRAELPTEDRMLSVGSGKSADHAVDHEAGES
ncbi:sensor histidine kinase [Microtetraspora sp. AC03309]|uniref:sensor histidine kinase n=1 Tax=Microtetraspora sp. AC03309 TaxID=2779376 RepID=UPI001E4E164A|nr:sensor histidine kinase [Microtetraspora sp. AC03309]MCC5578873.1 sensor histidine kinase [Microtetraspora sp. AC03309]